MEENNDGDHNKTEAQLTPLLGNSPAAKRTEFSTAPLFWGISKPSKLAGDGGVLVPSYPSPVAEPARAHGLQERPFRHLGCRAVTVRVGCARSGAKDTSE